MLQAQQLPTGNEIRIRLRHNSNQTAHYHKGDLRSAFSLAIQTTNQDAALQNVRVTLLKAKGT
jgi:hypothetical protein